MVSPAPNTRLRNVTVPPRLGKATLRRAYEWVVSSAIAPASAKASGVPPCASWTASPSTAKIPPPTMPPTPMETTAQKPIFPSPTPKAMGPSWHTAVPV